MKKILVDGLAYKLNTTLLNDPTDNTTAIRIFRDMTTDIYVESFFENDNNLLDFLDFTFHYFYSNIIDQFGIDISNFCKSNLDTSITPLVGHEKIYLVFKGGTLMNKFYEEIFTVIKNRHGDISSKNIFDRYGVNVTSFAMDLENMQLGGDKTDTFKNFCENILQNKFKISDTDYSLYINATTEERFLILHKFIIKILGGLFDDITKQFDNYIEEVINDKDNLLNNTNSIVDNTPDTTDDGHFVQIVKLDLLKAILADSKNIEEIKKNNLSCITNLVIDDDNFQNIRFMDYASFIITYTNLTVSDSTNTKLFSLYEVLEFIDLLIYLNIINNNFVIMNHIDRTNLDLNLIRGVVSKRITILVNKKMINLKNNCFYTYDKIQKFKQKLKDKYISIQNTKDTTSKNYYCIKIEKNIKPIIIEINEYQLRNQNNYTQDSFNIVPKKSVAVLSKNDEIDNINFKNVKEKKYHYITYNNVIRNIRNKSIVVDFDLIRSKLCVKLENGFITKNGIDASMNIPSEIIDISLSRFDDESKQHFFKDITKVNLSPYRIKLMKPNKTNVVIYAYSPENITQDLARTLFDKNCFEPWVDKKYVKRLIRLIVFIILSSAIEGETGMENCKVLVDLFISIYNYIFDKINEFPYKEFAFLVDTHDNLVNTIKYIKFISNNTINIIKSEEMVPKFLFIKKEFAKLDYIIQFLFMWCSIYYKTNQEIFDMIDIASNMYSWKHHYTVDSMDIPKEEFKKLISILSDYGTKLFYIFNLDQNMQTGGAYYQKYLKYKRQYNRMKYQ
jgi:hypothetical protein